MHLVVQCQLWEKGKRCSGIHPAEVFTWAAAANWWPLWDTYPVLPSALGAHISAHHGGVQQLAAMPFPTFPPKLSYG